LKKQGTMVCGPQNISKNNLNDLVRIYPNPAGEMAFIKVRSESQLNDLLITDISGKVMATKRDLILRDEKYELDTKDWVPGVYLIKMNLNEVVFTYKLIK
jgi:hypothetical protein